MWRERETVFYLNLYDGVVQKGRIFEIEKPGLWLSLENETVNKFLYTEDLPKKIFKEEKLALEALEIARKNLRQELLQGHRYVKEIVRKLEKEAGKFYSGVVESILMQKTDEK